MTNRDELTENGMALGVAPFNVNEREDALTVEDDDEQRCVVCDERSDDRICKACLAEYAKIGAAIGYGADRKTAVEINGFYAAAFTSDEIDEILARELTTAYSYQPAKITDEAAAYCMDDRLDFADWLEETNYQNIFE